MNGCLETITRINVIMSELYELCEIFHVSIIKSPGRNSIESEVMIRG